MRWIATLALIVLTASFPAPARAVCSPPVTQDRASLQNYAMCLQSEQSTQQLLDTTRRMQEEASSLERTQAWAAYDNCVRTTPNPQTFCSPPSPLR